MREKVKCFHCGSSSPEDAKFCPGCGRALEGLCIEQLLNYNECPFCGHYKIVVTTTLRPWRFFSCDKCGKNFKGLEVWTVHGNYLEKAADMLRFIDQYK